METIIGKHIYDINKTELTARCYRIKKNGQHKYRFNYKFHSLAQLETFVAKEQTIIKKEIADKEIVNAKIKESKKDAIKHFKVGDIFYDSWGYEQTNINFYQVVELKKASVVIREIAQNKITKGYLQGTTTPIKDDFIGDKILKRIITNYYNDKVQHYIKSKFGWVSRWDGRPKCWSSYA